MKELVIPPIAVSDPNSFEILRVWAANEEQHVSINSDLNGDASDFGYMLAQLAIHGSKLYSQKFNEAETKMLSRILTTFNAEIENNTGDPSGGF